MQRLTVSVGIRDVQIGRSRPCRLMSRGRAMMYCRMAHMACVSIRWAQAFPAKRQRTVRLFPGGTITSKHLRFV